MNRWCREFVLLIAFAVMPLQGIAATLSVVICHGDAQAHAMHDQGDPDRGASHDAYHPCCHYSVSAPAVMTQPAALPEFPIRAFAPDSLHDRFVPEQPHRPPLA